MIDRLIGSVTRSDILNHIGLLVIPANTVLTQTHIELIKKHQITIMPHHLVVAPASGGPTPSAPTASAKPKTNEAIVSKATEEMKSIFDKFRSGEAPTVSEMSSNLLPTIQEAIEFPSLFGLLSGLLAKDDYTFRHNIGVAVLSSMIGKWLQFDEERLHTLTLAAALHDIGKVKIEDDILNKPGRFTDAEYLLMKQHTVFGYEMLSNFDGLPEEVPLVALQHHERLDGKGYPHGIGGDQMTYFSKIVAVADVFHAMTSNRVYRGEIPFYKVLLQMKDDAFGVMDPFLCKLFVQRMMELAIGSEVVLSNQERGNIVMVYPDDPIRPLVQVQDRFFDLRQHTQIHIEKLVG